MHAEKSLLQVFVVYLIWIYVNNQARDAANLITASNTSI